METKEKQRKLRKKIQQVGNFFLYRRPYGWSVYKAENGLLGERIGGFADLESVLSSLRGEGE